jgi:hypothetical protein
MKFWTDNKQNSTRIRNVNYCFPQMVKLGEFLISKGIDCIYKLYDFSPEKIFENSEHRPYNLGEYKKSEKTNLIIRENIDCDYIFMFDTDTFFVESDFEKIFDLLFDIPKNRIFTFDLAKLDESTMVKIENKENINFFDENFNYAYSGKKENGPLGLNYRGGLGGVYICDINLIKENGWFDENYTGWGGEDGDMLSRIMSSDISYDLRSVNSFAPFHLPHFMDFNNINYRKRFRDEH